MAIVQDVTDRARDILQDDAKVRYTDVQMFRYVTDVYRAARSVRPDLFIGALDTPIAEVAALTETFLLPDQLISAAAFYVAGRSEIRDDEFAVDGRAMALMGSLTQKLVQGV